MSLLNAGDALALSASVAVDSSQLETGPRLILSVHLIAVAFGILLDGVVLSKLQGYMSGPGRDDKLAFKLLMGLIIVFQLAHVIFSIYGLHISFIDDFGQSDAFTRLPWPMAMLTIAAAALTEAAGSAVAAVVQCFFAFRLSVLYESKILGGVVALATIPGLVGGAMSGHGLISSGAAVGFAFRTTVLVGFVSPAVLDVIIALLFLARLRTYAKRTVHQHTMSLLRKIGILCVETNALTALHCTLLFVLFLANSPIYQAFVFTELPVYAFTLFVAFDSRNSSRRVAGTSGADSSGTDGLSRATAARKVQAIHVETVRDVHVGDLEGHFTRSDIIALEPTHFADAKAAEHERARGAF